MPLVLRLILKGTEGLWFHPSTRLYNVKDRFRKLGQ
jgi:hypothetical protein